MATEILRKAILKKNVGVTNKLKKNEEVLIKETYLGRGRTMYSAYKEADGFGVRVTRSEFDFTEEEKFVVFVTRTVQACKEIIVTAKDRKAAEEKALEEAGNYDFGSGDHAEYATGSIPLTIAEHRKQYPDSNLLKGVQ